MNPNPGAGSNPLAGGSGANPSAANPLAGGQQTQTPAQVGTNSPAGAQAGSNPPAGGSSGDQNTAPTASDADTAPISRDVYNERVRAEAALRKRVQELEAYRTAQENAKLTEQERIQKQLDAYQQQEAEWLIERQQLRMHSVVEAQVREKNLVAPANVVYAILMSEYADELDYDQDTGMATNAGDKINRLVEKYPWLVKQPTQAPPPGSGRSVSPPRNPVTGQYAPQQQQVGQQAGQQQQPSQQQLQDIKPVRRSLGEIEWSKPGENENPWARR
jgi:hypothetical protein